MIRNKLTYSLVANDTQKITKQNLLSGNRAELIKADPLTRLNYNVYSMVANDINLITVKNVLTGNPDEYAKICFQKKRISFEEIYDNQKWVRPGAAVTD